MKIPDLKKIEIDWDSNPSILLSEEDHLLRRFGFMEWISLEPDNKKLFRIRGEADEIMIAMRGEVQAHAIDVRLGSPTYGAEEQVILSRTKGGGLLLPFGIAYGVSAPQSAQALRISTHTNDSHAADRRLTAVEIESLLNA